MDQIKNTKQAGKKQRYLGTVGIITLTIIIAISMVWINTYRRSARYYSEGEQLFQQEKLLDAVTRFEIAAHAYTPWNPHVIRALERMWEIGQRFEKENEDPDYALIAYRSLRSSIYATRSFYTPNESWIPRCDKRIHVLVEIQKQRSAPSGAPTSSSSETVR